MLNISIFYKNKQGFSLVELAMAVAIIGILMSIAIPNYLRWKPNMELKSAARDLYANMQKAKINAIKENNTWAVIFNTSGNSYDLCYDSGGGAWKKVETVSLQNKGLGTRFGHGAAAAETDGDLFTGGSADNVSYSSNRLEFTKRGLGKAGYVYLEHPQSTSSYAVGTTFVGGIRILRWRGSDWK